jgi:hypothetical protein
MLLGAFVLFLFFISWLTRSLTSDRISMAYQANARKSPGAPLSWGTYIGGYLIMVCLASISSLLISPTAVALILVLGWRSTHEFHAWSSTSNALLLRTLDQLPHCTFCAYSFVQFLPFGM